MSTHARYSPSKLGKLAICPKWKMEDRPASEDAMQEGTDMHAAFEAGGGDLTAEQAQQVQQVETWMDAIRSTCNTGAQEDREVRVELANLTWGTTDALILDFDARRAHVLDAKFGRGGNEDAAKSLQVRVYGACVLETYPEFDDAVCYIAAPRTTDFSSVVVTRAELPTIRETILDIERHAECPWSSPVAADVELCACCAWRPGCPAAGFAVQQAVNKIETRFSVDVLVTPEELGKAKALTTLLDAWCRDTNTKLRDRALNGEVIQGYRLCERQGNAKITEIELAVGILRQQFGITDSEVLTVMKMGLPDTAKLVATKLGLKETEARKRVDAVLQGCVQRGASVQFLMRNRSTKKEIGDGIL